MESSAVVAFSKDPTRTAVKTRLSDTFDERSRNSIYKSLLEDCLTDLSALVNIDGGDTTLYLSCHPDKESSFYTELKRAYQPEPKLLNQSGCNLGEKMANTIDSLLAIHNKVVVFGSDTPLLPVEEISRALNRSDWHVVMGASLDGGYYCIGLDKSALSNLSSGCIDIFEGVEWSTDNVLPKTQANCAQLGLNVLELPAARDIDTKEDLDSLLSDIDAGKRKRIPSLGRVLESLELVTRN